MTIVFDAFSLEIKANDFYELAEEVIEKISIEKKSIILNSHSTYGDIDKFTGNKIRNISLGNNDDIPDFSTSFNCGITKIDLDNFKKNYIFFSSFYPFYKEQLQNENYKKTYLESFFKNIKKQNNYWVIFSNFHYNLALSKGIFKENLITIYPTVAKEFFYRDRELSYSYIKAKFGLTEPYLMAIGTLDESSYLNKILRFFYENNLNIKLVYLPYSYSKERVERLKVYCENKLDIVVLEGCSLEDQTNLLSSSCALIDFSSEYIVNLSKLKALFTDTPIITDLNPLNLEYFEDFPYYDGEISMEALLSLRERIKTDTINLLKEKFKRNSIFKKIIDIYKGED